MDALDALQQRVSVPRLGGDVPPRDVLENMFKAALRVADHAQLKPWRYLMVSASSRDLLGDLFVRAQLEDNPELEEIAIAKARNKPNRAPLIIVVIASPKAHPKVPEIEQILSAGAAAQNMLVAAYAQGVGAIWRTGGMAYHPTVMRGLGLSEHEKIVGFMYIGQKDGRTRNIPEVDTSEYFKSWPEIS